jgi:anti-sigma factor RsiW
MTAQLYRITCPTPTELGEYHLGVLPVDQIEAVSAHLAECPHCRREIAQLKDYLAELELAPGPDLVEQVVEHVRVLVARLVSGGPLGRPALAPAYAGLRGGEQEPLVYQAEEIQVMLDIQEDADRPDRRSLLGLVVGLGAPQGFQAHLWASEQLLATAPVDELGSFVLSNLMRGRYELMLSGPKTGIHIQDLDIGPN